MDPAPEPESPRKRQKLANDLDSRTLPEPVIATPITHTASMEVSRGLSAAEKQLQKEMEVGITEFVSPDLLGFTGILKKRYTDFLVNEILPSGQVLHLDNLKVPTRGQQTTHSTQTGIGSSVPLNPPREVQSGPAEPPAPQPAQAQPSGGKESRESVADELPTFQLAHEDEDLLASFFGVEVAKSIVDLHERILQVPNAKPREHGSVKSPVIDREQRTQIHQEIRRIFSSRLETSTNNDGAMIISAAATGNSRNARANGAGHARPPQFKGKLGWQDLGGEYLHFSLYKENKDTMEVISFLARQLKMKPQSFQFAGTKDRRGVTVQRVSVYRVYADRLAGLNRMLRGSKVGGFEHRPHGLELGELKGNEFVITLRDCNFPELEATELDKRAELASSIVKEAVQHLSNLGFINYYGLQRFGTFSTRTDTIGLKMLQGDFKGAVDAILDFSSETLAAAQDPLSSMSGSDMISSDDKARAHALHTFKTTGKIHPAIDDLPRKFSAEANIIRHLGGADRSKDYLGALQTIPRNLRLMYVHAYQSLVWNIAAGERWKVYGGQVVEGDLVLVNEHKDKVDNDTSAVSVDQDGEVIIRPAAEDSAANTEDSFTRARALSNEEVASGAYNIFDVVLPTPGYDILYPANDLSEVYKTFMASERGGGIDPHDMRRKWKDVSLSGSYRKILGRPGNCSFEIKSYSREDEQFVETDLQRIEKGKVVNGDRQPQEHEGKEAEGGLSEKLAVILKLQLGSSQYATMALRELMKLGGVKTYKPDFGGGR